jgi:hypothetical protein
VAASGSVAITLMIEQTDAPGRLPSLVATFRAALALLIIEILPGSG